MAQATHERPAQSLPPSMTRLDLTGSGGRDALLPVLPDATIEEIVAGVRAAGAGQVELLVPNNTEALQSLSGCETLMQVVEAAGLSVTLFTADEPTIAAASRAGLDVIAVGSSVLPEKRPATFRARPLSRLEPAPAPPPARTTPPNGIRQQALVEAPVVPEHPVVPDDAFLQGLQAFEQSQSPPPVPPGATIETPEGALLFDGPGDRGVPRRGPRAEWDEAFADMDATMAAEPAPPEQEYFEDAAAVEQPGRRRLSLPRLRFGKRDPHSGRSAETAVRRLQTASLRQPKVRAKNVAPEERLSLRWPIVAALAALLGLGAWFGLGMLGTRLGGQQITLAPAVPSSEIQTYSGLQVPLVATPAPGAIQGRVLEQPARVLLQGDAISTTVVPIGRATGTLVLRNRGSFPVTVRAGQVIQATNGATFTVDQEVTVPAATERPDGSGTIYGQGVAALTAIVPGAAGNIPAGSIGAIPGVEASLRVEQGAFSGGSDQEVRVVRTEDVNRLLPQAVSELVDVATRALAADAAQDPALALATSTITPTLSSLQSLAGIDVVVFPPIGGVTSDGTFTLELRGTFRGMAGPAGQSIPDQIAQVVREQLVTAGRAGPDAEVEIRGWQPGGAGLLVDAVVRPSGQVVPLSESFLAEVQSKLAGQSRADAEDYLETLVAEHKIAGYSPLPEDWETVPEKVVIKPEPQ